jgi:hypothetical protein
LSASGVEIGDRVETWVKARPEAITEVSRLFTGAPPGNSAGGFRQIIDAIPGAGDARVKMKSAVAAEARMAIYRSFPGLK